MSRDEGEGRKDEELEAEAEAEDEDEIGDEKAPAEQPDPLIRSPYIWLLLIPIVVVVWLVLDSSRENQVRDDLRPDPKTVVQDPLADDDMAALARALERAWAGEAVERDALPPRLLEAPQPVYVAFRADGVRLHHLWRFPEQVANPASIWDVLLQTLEDGRRSLGDKAGQVNRLEIDLSHSFRTHAWADAKARRLFLDEDHHEQPHHLGVRGFQVRWGDKRQTIAPTWQIARNVRTRKQLEIIRKQWGVSEDQLGEEGVFESFEADQILVFLDREPAEAALMFRGNRLVDVEAVGPESTEALASGMAHWIIDNVNDEGRLVYQYFPGIGKRDKGNNMIRQWMATNAMVRWGLDREDPAVLELAERNIDYNLGQFFHYEELEGKTLGVIEYRGQTKLGATALAGMALWLHPKRDEWAEQIAALRAMVDHLFHDEDGTFDSFYKGSDKQVYQFYPGEAMLWWATIYAEEKDPALLAKYKKAFAYFSQWHLEPRNRRPAFVPWHLQANYAMWSALGEDEAAFKQELVDFNFEIADWLVDTQQWGEDELWYPDEWGRFYVPDEDKPYGVPHASSTGVYIEGLIDAWELAKRLGDEERRERYRLALVRALRSMMQLQFVDEVDMYYVAEPEVVNGGLRTAVFDNRIRCDNVQHPLMGIIKLLRKFEADEYGAG